MNSNGWIGCSLTLMFAAGISPRRAAAEVTATCAATPALAAAQRPLPVFAPAPGQAGPHFADAGKLQPGYRLMGRREDAAHARSWALVARCDSPQSPWTAVRLSDNRDQHAAAQPIVAAGAAVLFRSTAVNANIRIPAEAQQGGAAGDRIRIRLKPVFDDAATPRFIEAVIVNSGEVEGEL